MSSNIRVKKNCDYCGKEYEARTTVTRYCSHKCNSRHYKQLKRKEMLNDFRIEQSRSALKLPDINFKTLSGKAFLSVRETSVLLSISERTLFRMMADGALPYHKLGRRTILRRDEIDQLFQIQTA